MVVLKQIRVARATSEPVEPVRLIDLQGVDTARRISLAARDDTDELMMASKRHDRQLLSDINAKLANQSFLSPPAKVKRAYAAAYSSPRKPPISPATRSGGSAVTSASTIGHRRYQFQNLDNSDDAYSMPPTPVTRSVMRAASLPPTAAATSIPPPPAGAVVVPDGFDRPFCPLTYATMKLGGSQLNGPTTALYSDLDTSSSAQNGVDSYGGFVRTRVTGPPAKLTPVTDLAIRQAHRDLDRIERELKYQPAEGSNRYQYTPKSMFTVTPDETPSAAVRRPLPTTMWINSLSSSTTGGGGAGAGGAGSLGSLRFRAASLSPARSFSTTATGVTTGYRGASHFSPAAPVTRRRTSPVRPSELIALMTIASPTKTASDSKVTSHATSTRLYEVPTLTSYRASTEPSVYQITSSSTTGTTPVFRHTEFSTTAPTSTGGRPKMSEARRKVRDVLCKVKKDPHYFD